MLFYFMDLNYVVVGFSDFGEIIETNYINIPVLHKLHNETEHACSTKLLQLNCSMHIAQNCSKLVV